MGLRPDRSRRSFGQGCVTRALDGYGAGVTTPLPSPEFDEVDAADDVRQVVVFRVGGGRYALPIDAVQEVVRYEEPQHVSADVPALVGVLGLRGRIIPVYDVAQRLGLTRGEVDGAAGKVLIANTRDGRAGLVVDDVEQVITLSPGAIHEPPAGSSASTAAIAQVGDELIVLLDAEQLVDSGGQLAASPESAPEVPS